MSRWQCHKPVLFNEVIEYLKPHAGGLYMDCTLGGGGHAREILRVGGKTTRLIGIDRDKEALNRLKNEFGTYGGMVELAYDRYENLSSIAAGRKLDGILLDLGVSSFMLDEAERGFSFMQDGPLDMRMDRSQTITAADIINSWSHGELAHIFKQYGEEPMAGRVASAILRSREESKIVSTIQLAEIVAKSLPYKNSRTHPATKVFQALRIAVNGELEQLGQTLTDGISQLSAGGRMVVISFHSLEDRIVKRTFSGLAKGCVCPPRFPVCRCGIPSMGKALTRKPVTATEDELQGNPRSRSAKMRVFERATI